MKIKEFPASHNFNVSHNSTISKQGRLNKHSKQSISKSTLQMQNYKIANSQLNPAAAQEKHCDNRNLHEFPFGCKKISSKYEN